MGDGGGDIRAVVAAAACARTAGGTCKGVLLTQLVGIVVGGASAPLMVAGEAAACPILHQGMERVGSGDVADASRGDDTGLVAYVVL